MVCQDCEKKLSKVIVPDKWKDGARNVTGGDDGGRATTYRNSLLQVRGRTQRFTAGVRGCKICKSKVAQDAHYCQECAHHHGICARCGRRRRFARPPGACTSPRRRSRSGTTRATSDGGYGTSEGFKKRKTEEALRGATDGGGRGAARRAAPAVDEAEERRRRDAEKTAPAMDAVANAMARSQGRTIDDGGATKAREEYAKWSSATDASSGRTCARNAETRQTSWVWPPGKCFSLTKAPWELRLANADDVS
ncbi:cytoskeletal microtubule protein [Aureococcus anophagefferens]|uniref:Cysteine-rich PDZ-binding protein n=1 Tax=Aureococcus anophagefferens TaxID=44056 RepID=A0ABR1FYC5_AURAN